MRHRERSPLVVAVLAALSVAWKATPPHEYGMVTLEARSSAAGVPPVIFQHWRHRGAYTCRVCHIDIGFAMASGETRITAASNRAGQYCGACHDGRKPHRGKPVFPACSEARALPAGGDCRRCHARLDAAEVRASYEAFVAEWPRLPSGHVDWERAETDRVVRPADFVEGVSIQRGRLRMDKDVAIESRGSWMANIVFSHRKHAAWNGCEVCHPDIFPRTKAGATRYSMIQISGGEYCGVCHDKVAFPIGECERCHTTRVR